MTAAVADLDRDLAAAVVQGRDQTAEAG